MFLVTAYPRSGTSYAAAMLKAAGFEVAHETLGQQGCVSWLHIRSGEWLYKIPKVRFEKTVHLVRDPLNVISSAMTLGDYSLVYMLEHIPGIKFKSKLHLVMHTWVEWNRIIEQAACCRFRVETLEHPGVFSQLCRILGREAVPPAGIPRNINSRQELYRMLGWGELEREDLSLTRMIRKMANKYGYGT